MYKAAFYYSCKFSDGILIEGLKTKGLEILETKMLGLNRDEYWRMHVSLPGAVVGSNGPSLSGFQWTGSIPLRVS